MSPREEERDLLGLELGKAVRILNEERRTHGLRGLSVVALAKRAGFKEKSKGNRLWRALNQGSKLTTEEWQRTVAALADVTYHTVEYLGGTQTRQEVLGRPVTFAAGVVDLPYLSQLAGLPAQIVTNKEAAVLLLNLSPTRIENWQIHFAQGKDHARRHEWSAAAQAYSRAAAQAAAVGDNGAAALSLSRQMEALVTIHQYGAALNLVTPILDQLGISEFWPDGEWTTRPLGPQLARLEAQLVGGELGREAYIAMCSTYAYCMHCMDRHMDRFPRAYRAAKVAVEEGERRHNDEGRKDDDALADAHHFLAKTLMECATVADIDPRDTWGLWRSPNPKLSVPRWEQLLGEALKHLDEERSLRPPENVIGLAHSWRNQMRALSALAEKKLSYIPQLTEAMRRARSYYTDGTTGSLSSAPLISLYVDQARYALRKGDDTWDPKRIRQPAAQAVELARKYGADGHATWAWRIEAELILRNGHRRAEEKAKQRILLSLGGWSQPFDSRDSTPTLVHSKGLGITEHEVRQFFNGNSPELDLLSGFPGFDPVQRLNDVLRRLGFQP